MPSEINLSNRRSTDWSDSELRASVNAYVKMLRQQFDGNIVNFNECVSELKLSELPNRSFWSVKLRMQNISSVMYDLKLPTLQYCGISHNVGAGVKERVISMLYDSGIGELEPFMMTANREELEKRVTELRKSSYDFRPTGSIAPQWEMKSTKSYIRSPDVKAWILENSNGICESCKNPAQFLNVDGFPYLEVHHVLPLARNGSDTISNTVALCPNCHMRCHYSIDRDEFKLKLYQTITRLVLEVPDPDLEIKNSEFINISVSGGIGID